MASAAVSTAVKAATESLAFPKRSGVFQAVLGALEEIAPVHLAGSWYEWLHLGFGWLWSELRGLRIGGTLLGHVFIQG